MRLVSPLGRLVVCLPVAVVGLVFAGVSPETRAADRREPQTVTKSGTIVELQQKGRGRTLVVDIDGTQHSVPVTPKLDLKIIAAGDRGFVRPGQFVTAAAIFSNDKLFISALTVHPQRRGQKPLVGKITKTPAAPGESQLGYDVSGVVIATQPNQEYPDHTDVALKTAGQSPPVMLEPGVTVTVSSGEPDKIPANAPAEFEVAELRGGRLSIVGITVRLDTPLTAAEYFGDKPEKPTDQTAAGEPEAKPAP